MWCGGRWRQECRTRGPAATSGSWCTGTVSTVSRRWLLICACYKARAKIMKLFLAGDPPRGFHRLVPRPCATTDGCCPRESHQAHNERSCQVGWFFKNTLKPQVTNRPWRRPEFFHECFQREVHMIFDYFQTLIVRRHYLSNCSPIHSVNFTLAIPRDKLRHWHLPGSPSGDLPIWAEVLAGGCGGASQVHLGLRLCDSW